MKKNITITASSVISVQQGDTTEEMVAETYSATIDSNDPENMSISRWQQNKPVYKANRAQCRKDSAEFEDAVYALQDEMIAANAAVTE